MNRIVDLLFAENFFLDEITWKVGEKNRQCIKKSNTLKCWKGERELIKILKNFIGILLEFLF